MRGVMGEAREYGIGGYEGLSDGRVKGGREWIRDGRR